MPEVIAVVGPTAVGKSALAVRLAAALDGEVVSTDSMQAYRGMAIGTAAPTPVEQAGIAHHLIGVIDPNQALTVAEFQRMAREAIDAILRRGRTPVVVGGSGLYVSAVLDDLRFPGTDPDVRQRWDDALAEMGPQALHAVLAERDPRAAEAILPTNGRRIVRALEVGDITGAPFIAHLPDPVAVVPARRIGLSIARDDLDARIASRVDAMLAAGMVDEVRALAPVLRTAPTASRALGYPQLLDYLDGRTSLDEARQRTIDATRRFARRQERWFRRDRRVTWVPYDADDLLERALGSETCA